MTCYQRHLGWLFEAIDRPFDKPHKREVHEALIALLGLPEDAHCPEVWASMKTTYGIDATTPSAELAADLARQMDAGVQ